MKNYTFFFLSIQDKRVLNWTVDFGHLEEVTVSDQPVVIVLAMAQREKRFRPKIHTSEAMGCVFDLKL